ncbi:MAG: hypothetical protein M0Z41_15860 [Peptococcaceae bacterium]|jgi:hypothetical protein|nr:hypothetical protein [Peptococcaceae bacterium]
MFVRVFKGTGTTFTYVAVPDPDFHPERWWTSGSTILQMCYQYTGIAVFYMGLGPYVTSAWISDTPSSYLFRYMPLRALGCPRSRTCAWRQGDGQAGHRSSG